MATPPSPPKSDFESLLADARAMHRQGEITRAAAIYTELLARDPAHAGANYLLGAAHFQRRQFELALSYFDRAIESDPGHADAYFNRGNTLRELQRFMAAIKSYDAALLISPRDAVAHSNRAVTLQAMGRNDEAVSGFQTAVTIDPNYPIAHYHLGNALQDLGDLQQAVQSYQRALDLDPTFPFLRGALLHLRMRICDWSGFDEALAALLAAVDRNERASPLLPLLALSDSPRIHREAAATWGNERSAEISPVPITMPSVAGRKIHLGYFSADFQEHPVAFLMASMFELHDKSRFELTAFSFGPDSNSSTRARVVGAFDRFMNVRDLTDVEIARTARDLHIDIAIDLMGYTAQSRPAIFAYRAAPIQLTYLGFPGTLALPCIDYLMADRIVIPETSRPFYTEAIAYLPDSYQANDSKRPVDLPAPSRARCGLPDDAFIFCCFNNNHKILPETFAGWMRILRCVPDSVLWIFEDNTIARRNLCDQALAHGIEPSRLAFAQRVSMLQHLARQQVADLFLDTYPYNAHTTASDALWVGLPVLTRSGPSFASRVAASLLTAVGLEELITDSQEEFERLAIELATEKTRLKMLRSSLKTQGKASRLFDAKRFATGFESLLEKMVDDHLSGKPPADIDVKELAS